MERIITTYAGLLRRETTPARRLSVREKRQHWVLTTNAQDWDSQQQVKNLGPDEPRCAMAYLAWIASELVPQPAFRREPSYRRSLNPTSVRSFWKSLLTSYPPSGIEVCECEEAEGDGRPAGGRAGRSAGSRLPAPWPLPLVTSIWCVR